MDGNDWKDVENIVFQWIDKHPWIQTAMDRSLALWLEVQNYYEVCNSIYKNQGLNDELNYISKILELKHFQMF